MATLNLSVSITDEDLPRLLAAARGTFSQPDMTVEVMVEYLRQYGMDQMKQMVKNYERRVAIAAAEALDPTLEVS